MILQADRVIMHVDMNAFFASVEQQANPALRGKPIAVTGSGRTVITTASYEARAWGVKTGMNKYEARKLCPVIIFLNGDYAKYADTSTRIIAILRDYTPMVEVLSIDEAFLDLTGSLRLFGSAERIAYLLKARIRQAMGLTCSIGIAPNKLLAKLASDMKKPDGLTIIRPEDLPGALENIPVGDLCGVGRNLKAQIESFGIRTCGELGRYPVDVLRRRFGVVGQRLHFMGLGIDDSPVVPDEKADAIKSVGHTMTLRNDTTDMDFIRRQIQLLSEMVGRRARRAEMAGKTVTLTIRYADFTTFDRQQSHAKPTNETGEIYLRALKILDTLQLVQPVRMIGVRLSGLEYGRTQLSLFPEERKKTLITEAMDGVNNRYGDFTVTFATLIEAEGRGRRVISPSWRPDADT
ncbi:MAG: DNA polymerase IV [Nitrospirae bacterium]|nr:DNA polymerase IV [Nitrospirota bacterium]